MPESTKISVKIFIKQCITCDDISRYTMSIRHWGTLMIHKYLYWTDTNFTVSSTSSSLYFVCCMLVCCMLIGVFCLFSSTSCILYNLHLCMLYGSIPIKGRRQNCGFKSLLTKAFYLSRLAILLHNEIHKTTMLSGFLLYEEFWDNNVSFNYYN